MPKLQTIKLWHALARGNVPPSLADGELAIDQFERQIFFNDPDAGAVGSLLDQLAVLNPSNNMFMNPGMEIDQNNVGTALTGVGAAQGYIIDGCLLIIAGTVTARFTTQQVTDAPSGFKNSLKLSCTTAQASFTSTSLISLGFPVEGYILRRAGWGAAGALAVGFGFWFKAHRTGQYGGVIQNNAATRSYPFSFTVSVADTWEYHTIVVPGDTTGTWVADNTGTGLWFCLTVAAGSSMVGTANTWAAANIFSATGQINGCAATSDTLQITGLTAFVGNVACPQERSALIMPKFDQTLLFCQRYYEKSYDYNELPGGAGTSIGIRWFQVGSGSVSFSFLVEKRIVPTVTFFSPVTGASARFRDTTTNVDVTILSPEGGTKYYEGFPNSGAASDSMTMHYKADARM